MLKTGNMVAGSQTGKYLQYMNTKKTRFTETLNPVRIVFGLTGENIYTQLYWKTDEDRTGVYYVEKLLILHTASGSDKGCKQTERPDLTKDKSWIILKFKDNTLSLLASERGHTHELWRKHLEL